MSDDRVDRYEVTKVLGEGGMGRVVLARDPLLGRALAVKTLLSQAPTAALRFAEEAQVTGQLDHPNIIPVHAFGQDDGVPYLAMRFVQGRDMKALIDELQRNDRATKAAYGLRRLLRLFLKVCGAVGHAHARGVIHRDLKPANVMLGEDDEVLVMDWGLAKPIKRAPGAGLDERGAAARLAHIESLARAGGADLTQEGAIVGTPIYMAPEQAADGTVSDPRADVYALGALLYELLTLRQPYEGSSLEVITALITGKPTPRPARQAAPRAEIPVPVEKILLKAMARGPDDRYPDAAALAADVEAFLDERPISCHRESAREALSRIASRHRVTLGALAAALIGLAAAGGSARLVTRARERVATERAAEASAAKEAASDRQEAALVAAANVTLVAQAEARASQAGRLLGDLRALARTAAPLAQLRARRDEAARTLDGHAAWIADLSRGRPGAAAALAPALARARAAREEVDVTLGRALVARWPALAATQLEGLAPGAEGPLLRARALAALGQGAEAQALLGTSRWGARADLAAAAAVVARLAEDAPAPRQLEAVQAALKQAPGAAWLVGLRGHLRAREGDLAGARADFERAVALDPADARVAEDRFLALFPLTMHEERFPALLARHAWSLGEAPELPRRPMSDGLLHEWAVQVWHYGWWDRYTKSAADERERGALTPLRCLLFQAEAALICQHHEPGERAAREALALAPDDRRGLGLLAELLVGQGKLAPAKEVADRGLQRHPTDGRLAYARGEVARLEGDLALARRLLRLGAERAPYPDRWERLARCLAASEAPADWEEGVQAMRTGLQFDVFDSWLASHESRPLTGDPRYHRVLGDLRRKQGNLAAAALHYRRALWAQETPDARLAGRIKAALEGDLTDAMRLGEVHEEMRLPWQACYFYDQARQDPKLQAEATRRLERLTGGRR